MTTVDRSTDPLTTLTFLAWELIEKDKKKNKQV